MIDLEGFLFHEPFGTSRRPLFESKVDLARLIREQGYDDTRSVDGIRAYLYQILSGERSPSNTFVLALKDVVSREVEARGGPDAGDLTDLSHRIDDLIESTQDDPDLRAFKEADVTAKHHFIATALPAELIDNDQARVLRANLIRRLGLDREDGIAHVRYEFCVPELDKEDFLLPGEKSTAEQLWDAILESTMMVAKVDEATALEMLLARYESKHLIIREAPIAAVFPPYIAFDPYESLGSRCKVFVLDYSDAKEAKYVQMSSFNNLYFSRTIYKKIVRNYREFDVSAKVPQDLFS
ncbi:MAG: hypothetical protein AAFQ86_15665 [Bacteroidota bacterium]